ncbi:hypothetical protein OH76DRAFT_1305437, partial [Lentinus brumalis]
KVPAHIVAYVKKAVRAAYKDPVRWRDFALSADGARTAPKLTSPVGLSPKNSPRRTPDNILDEDLRSASCWMFSGDRAQVGIRLPSFIYPTHFTLDYVPFEVAADIRQAPREVVLWGVLDGPDNWRRYEASKESIGMSPLRGIGDGPPITDIASFVPLAVVEFNIHDSLHIQTFIIDSTILASRISFGVFVLDV